MGKPKRSLFSNVLACHIESLAHLTSLSHFHSCFKIKCESVCLHACTSVNICVCKKVNVQLFNPNGTEGQRGAMRSAAPPYIQSMCRTKNRTEWLCKPHIKSTPHKQTHKPPNTNSANSSHNTVDLQSLMLWECPCLAPDFISILKVVSIQKFVSIKKKKKKNNDTWIRAKTRITLIMIKCLRN